MVTSRRHTHHALLTISHPPRSFSHAIAHALLSRQENLDEIFASVGVQLQKQGPVAGIEQNDKVVIFALSVLQAVVGPFFFMGAKRMQSQTVRRGAAHVFASLRADTRNRHVTALLYFLSVLNPTQEIVALTLLTLVVAGLLYDGMLHASQTAVKPIAARMRGRYGASAEAVWRTSFFQSLLFFIISGVLAAYVLPNIEDIVGWPRLVTAVVSPLVPAVIVCAHGRRLI